MESARRSSIVGALFLTACSATALLSTWRAPNVERLSFGRVLVYAPLKDPSLRHTAEDTIVQQMKVSRGVPSYTILSDAEMGDQELVRKKAREGGFDGLVVFRVASVDKQATWVPGDHWGPSYAGYYGWVYDPGYVQIDTLVRVETNVYSVAENKLVWASASQTTNPSSVSGLAKEVAVAVAKEMRREMLIP